jgi:hypothetical protein
MKLSDLINEKGRTSSTKTRESYIKNNFRDSYKNIIEFSEIIGITERTFSEKIYHFLNNIESPVVCKNCLKNKTKYRGLVSGYLEYCSLKCSNSSSEVMELKKISYFEKHGVDNPSKSPDVIAKIQNTFDIKYGGNPAKNEEIKKKTAETCIQKYKDKHPFGKNSTLRKKITNDKEKEFVEKYKDLNIVLYRPEKNSTCIIKCKKCNNNYEISKWNLHQRFSRENYVGNSLCTFCNPIGSSVVTSIESFIIDLLEKNKICYRKDRNIIKPYEIDFLIESKGIGIETNGIYWHPSKFKDSNYHLRKTEECLKKGIRLIHVFEDDFVLRKDILESRISSLLGIHQRKIYARNCEIKEIDTKECGHFLDNNHIQGKTGSSVRIGLFYEGSLVSVMTFGKERKSLGSLHKEGKWELIRFCNEKNNLIVGGASKLLKFFINKYNPQKITSFCDRRWSPETDFYEKLGFIFKHNTNPNYWYYPKNSYEKKHRFNFRKDVLVGNGADPSKTELELMDEMGYLRVYDCGSSKWELKIKSFV